jgi:hypothetical protein
VRRVIGWSAWQRGLDFAVLRGPLRAALARGDWGKGGRLLFDPVMMFPVLVLQALCLLLDEGCAFPRKDRLSFPRLAGLGRDGRVLEATPVWRLWEEMGTGQGEQPALCPLRCGADRSGLSGDSRPDHRGPRGAGA